MLNVRAREIYKMVNLKGALYCIMAQKSYFAIIGYVSFHMF